MNIYFAYRHPEVSLHHRYLKKFTGNSILEWFQSNWDTLLDGNGEEIFGISLHGLSTFKRKKTLKSRENYQELQGKLHAGLGEVHYAYASEHCVEVLGDDDDFDWACYIFDEVFLKDNEEKMAIWFEEELPDNYSNKSDHRINLPGDRLIPKGKAQGATYYLSNAIYETAHLNELAANHSLVVIDKIRIPDLLSYFRQNRKVRGQEYSHDFLELQLIQKFSKLLPEHDLQSLLEEISRFSFTDLDGAFDLETKLTSLTLSDLESIDRQQNAKVLVSEHIIQVISGLSNFIFFDDFWVAANETLANSICHYFANWRINS